MAGAKTKMLDYMLSHVGLFIPIEKLRIASGNVSDWARSIRTLRGEGWDIVVVTKPEHGYILRSSIKREGNVRENIDDRTRYLVLERDKSTCQRCGKTPADGVKMHIDHIIPVKWGGTKEMSNLQTLCAQCNQGKKDFVSKQDPKLMTKISKAKSAYEKIKIFVEENPNKDISFDIFDSISQIREWTRTLRLIRSKEKYDIKAIKKGGIWYYRYEK